MDALLELSNYGISFGRKTVLRNINLRIPENGMVILLGPSGTGKSTLLRTLSGANDASPSLQTEGQASFLGHPLGVMGNPAIVMQKTCLMMATLRENIVNEMPERVSLQLYQQREVATRLLQNAGLEHLAEDLERSVIDLTLGEQRLIALVRTIASNPRMILVDEPTANVSDEDAERILRYLKKESKKRAILTVLHNQKQAIALGGTSILLAGGSIVEIASTEEFFKNPRTELGKDFVRTGSCSAPSPDAKAEDLDEKYLALGSDTHSLIIPEYKQGPRKPKREIKSHAFGPRNFLWLRKGQLAGTPRPGLTLDLDIDLAALRRVGISVLVSLESEVDPIPQEALTRHFIQGISFPIKDMSIPELEDARALCIRMEEMILQGEAIALHCKAGIGRTGTMLVTYMIWTGMSSLDALETARKIEPRWVQSQEQVRFLEHFESFISRYSGSMETAVEPITAQQQ